MCFAWFPPKCLAFNDPCSIWSLMICLVLYGEQTPKALLQMDPQRSMKWLKWWNKHSMRELRSPCQLKKLKNPLVKFSICSLHVLMHWKSRSIGRRIHVTHKIAPHSLGSCLVGFVMLFCWGYKQINNLDLPNSANGSLRVELISLAPLGRCWKNLTNQLQSNTMTSVI